MSRGLLLKHQVNGTLIRLIIIIFNETLAPKCYIFVINNVIMIELHPQFIKDSVGSELVVLPREEFDNLIEELEEMEDIRLYDEAMLEDDGERIPMEDAFKIIEEERGKLG